MLTRYSVKVQGLIRTVVVDSDNDCHDPQRESNHEHSIHRQENLDQRPDRRKRRRHG